MARPSTAAVRLTTGEREPCRLATTANITLSGLQTIDGVLTEVGDRVLVKNQTDQTENGIYTASAGEWYRAADARTARNMQKGTTVHIQQGSTNESNVYSFQTYEPNIGEDAITLAFYTSDDTLGDVNDAVAAGLVSIGNAGDAEVADISAAGAAQLDAIAEAGADVTAIKAGDTDASGFGFVIDEDDMASDSPEKLPTQQSVKAYVDGKTGTTLGAVADGDGDGGGTDISTTLQSMIDTVSSAGGGEITIPRNGTGVYRLASIVDGKSNVTVRVAPGVQIDLKDVATSVLLVDGSAGSEIFTSGDYTRGDDTITTAAAHGLAVGDLVHIVSQRNCLSVDAGDWRLGNGTVSLNYAYFAEFLEVAEIVSTTVFRATTPLIFPSYKDDVTDETDTERTGTTIKKVTPVRNFHWIGGEFLNVAGSGLTRGRWSVDCSVQDIITHRGSEEGGLITWEASYRCFGKNIKSYGDPAIVWDYDTMHGGLNRFRTTGSQDCGYIDCYDEYSAQSTDFSYGGSFPYANVRSYSEGCTTYRCFEGVTSHPGCYMERWERNKWLECFDSGIIVRGLRALVSGNIITSSSELVSDILEPSGDVSVGVDLYDGHAKDAIVHGNDISGFRYATRVRNGGTDSKFTEVRASIKYNTISRCYGGLITDFTSTADATLRGIDYSDNVHSFMERYVVNLGQYSAGCNFDNNILFGAFVNTAADTSAAFINATSNCPALTGVGNKWYRPAGSNAGLTLRAVSVSSVSDTTTYPSGSFANKSDFRDFFVEADISTKITFGSTNYVQTKEFMDGNAGLSNGLLSGTYTPTLTATTNVSASTAAVCNWLRVGNMVHVTGTLQATATATGQTTLGISFPIASTLSAATDCGGSGANFSANAAAGLIEGETANNRARFRFNATGTTSTQFGFSFMYRLL